MRALVICRSVGLGSSKLGYIFSANECVAGQSFYGKWCTSCVDKSRSRLVATDDWLKQRGDFRVRRFCTNKGQGETPPNGDTVGDWNNTRIPRRLIKRLKKQGISESQFISKLYSKEEDHIHVNNNNNVNFDCVRFTGSQEDLENLIKDMSEKPKYRTAPELETFPSDMARLKEMEKKGQNPNMIDSKLHIDPSSTSVLLFPGQGSQFVGMGKKLLHFPGVKDMYDEASTILGYDLLKLCLNGPKSELNKTIHCQAAVMITSIAALEKLREEHPKAIENCVATAGFSVGEFAAMVFSGVLSLPDAIEVVKTRAEAMQKASERVNSGMLSVFLAHDSDLKSAMKMAKEYCNERQGIHDPVCQIANYLFPECKVIAGHTEALEFISANKKDFHLLRVKHLPVSGAFHTKLMGTAVTPLENVLKKIKIGAPKLPVYSNLTGQPYYHKSNFVHKLCQQMVRPVKWEQIMHAIYKRSPGVDFPQTFELGPSQQMGTLLKQINLQAYKSYRCIEV